MVPRRPRRGLDLATHFNNYCEAASPDELEAYMTERLRQTMRVAKQVGMRVSVGDALNGGFPSTPQELRCTPVPDLLGRHGNFGVNLCPSNPAAKEQLLKNWEGLRDQFVEPGLDCVTSWP